MINTNMYPGASNWWTQHNKKKEGYKPPDKCTFCSKKIEDGDHFYAGRDSHNIYAETCEEIKCHTWLKYKTRVKKVPGKDYLKEMKDREKQ